MSLPRTLPRLLLGRLERLLARRSVRVLLFVGTLLLTWLWGTRIAEAL